MQLHNLHSDVIMMVFRTSIMIHSGRPWYGTIISYFIFFSSPAHSIMNVMILNKLNGSRIIDWLTQNSTGTFEKNADYLLH